MSSCCFPKNSQLNGNNGEATNTDDLNNRKSNSVQNKKIANLERKIANLPRKKKEGKKSKRKQSRNNRDPIARLLADPCHAPLVPIYGGQNGYLARNSQPATLSNFTGTSLAGTSGYCVWFPQYFCAAPNATASTPVNFYIFTQNASATPTLNGSLWYSTAGAGTAYAANTAVSIPDAASQFMQTGIAEDARCLSACLTLQYTGTTANASGLFFPLTNVPLDLVFNGGSSGTGTMPNYFMMSRYAGSGKRADGKCEVKFTPDSQSMSFQDVAYGPLIGPTSAGTAPSGDAAISRTAQPMGFGFAWQNISAQSDYILTPTKAYEWRPKASSGLSANTSTVSTSSPDFVNRAVTRLNKISPDWQSQAYHMGMDLLGNQLRHLVLGGSDMAYSVPRSTNRMIEF